MNDPEWNRRMYQARVLGQFYDSNELSDFVNAANLGKWDKPLAWELLWDQTKENWEYDQALEEEIGLTGKTSGEKRGNNIYRHIAALEKIFNPRIKMGEILSDEERAKMSDF
ncbi:hypothetical protein HOA55_00170 [archaeon]|jgi:hypothetical protein|nr:hypothetical protein [archaeon]MBT3577881.1 hypothetical protein [archaeon]MBT6819755.1 hypothetical protein [archaeon]MBT6955962.1 hypothetical protein [archaeon]MBT7025537.1 hypothetical protein [archaeon]